MSSDSPPPSLNFDPLGLKGWQVFENFFTQKECYEFLNEIKFLEDQELLKEAEVGKDQNKTLVPDIRLTQIFWVQPSAPSLTQKLFLEKMYTLMHQLKQVTFIPLDHLECHYSVYPVGGFYERHLDQFRGDPSRQISFVLYLDNEWEARDGGELILYKEKDPRQIDELIFPSSGRLVIFMSESIEHEVRPTQRKRHSFTGWMRIANPEIPLAIVQ